MKNKKGVSPLIAWVLIIGLSVSIGFLVINWAMQTVPEPEPELSFCDDVNLFLIDSYVDGDEFVFDITNNGLFTITMWSFGVTQVHSGSTGWCNYLDSELPPGENNNMILSFPIKDYPTPDCDDATGPESEIDPKEIILIPWITPIGEEESVNCNDKKIIINL